jgi:hypothetical protein
MKDGSALVLVSVVLQIAIIYYFYLILLSSTSNQ